MKKETTIDLAKLKEAKATIHSIQHQFYEMLMDEIENHPVFECDSMGYTHNQHSTELYCSSLTISNLSVSLLFLVCPVKDEPDLSSDFSWMNLKIYCSELDISNQFIEPRKNLTVTLHFKDTGKDMLLQYTAPGN